MTSPPPELSREFCFSPGAIQAFLRTSRAAVDDSVGQHLSSLARPPKFEPSSTSYRNPSHRLVPSSAVDDFERRVLFPAWASRGYVLAYCSRVSSEIDSQTPSSAATTSPKSGGIDVGNKGDTKQSMDWVQDPYNARGSEFGYLSKAESLGLYIRQEQGVEKIIRERSYNLVKERSTDGRKGQSWEEAFKKWEKEEEESGKS